MSICHLISVNIYM